MPKAESNNQASIGSIQGGLTLRGPVTLETVTHLKQQSPVFTSDTMIVSCAETTEVDSAGIALLLHWKGLATKAGGDIRYTELPAQAVSLIQITGVEEVLTV